MRELCDGDPYSRPYYLLSLACCLPTAWPSQGLYDLACDYSFFSFGYHLYTYLPIYQDLQGKEIINSRVNSSMKNCIVYVVITLH